MSYDEPLVGSLAMIIAGISLASALGSWSAPYRLRSISIVQDRFGKPAARCVWLALAVASFAAGTAILSGTRPSYADPSEQQQPERHWPK